MVVGAKFKIKKNGGVWKFRKIGHLMEMGEDEAVCTLITDKGAIYTKRYGVYFGHQKDIFGKKIYLNTEINSKDFGIEYHN